MACTLSNDCVSYVSPSLLCIFFLKCYVEHRDLHSFPTRRSSDLTRPIRIRSYRALVRQRPGSCPRWCRRNSRKDRKSTRLNSSHVSISYAVFCLKKKNTEYAYLAPHVMT